MASMGIEQRDYEVSGLEGDEVPLQWAEIQRLKTVRRAKTSLLMSPDDDEEVKVVNVTKLGAPERRLFMKKLIKNVEEDNLRLLKKVRERINRVGIKLPTVEVRYKNLCVDAECRIVDGKPLPTLWNTLKGMFSFVPKMISCESQEARVSILKGVSGVLKPSRLTLLLGPPGCGKTTLLLALAGQLEKSLKVSGEISYNGYRLDEFVPQKTSAYISQNDLHLPEMTVRETIDFAARCQGVGDRADILMEVIRREKAAGIIPDLDTDVYMKAISVFRLKETLQTDYVLKILGLDECSDTLVGNEMKRGISGGQKKRLTTGELIVGPTKALFMDEISNGLDSSTTFRIVTCLQQLAHITDASVLVSLLQPAPEVFNLFDDVILMAQGKIVYHGPCKLALQYFEGCGFRCPERKGVADFLQEVISEKDQAQYWYRTDLPYDYISVEEFSEIFKSSTIGEELNEALSKPCDRSRYDKNELSLNGYSLSAWELFKACMSREFLLMKRNYALYLFKTTQLLIIAFMTMTVFIRTRMSVDLEHSNYFMGALFYTLVRLMSNGVAELSMTIARLPVFYKQNGLHLFPAWAYALPASILKLPVAMVESILWTVLTYYVVGYSPEIERFFYQLLLLLFLHQASTAICRFVAAIFQTDVVAIAAGILVLVLIQLFGGYIIPRSTLPDWLKWAFWLSPMSYGEIAISLNEFLAPRWQKISTGNSTLGKDILASYGLNFDAYFYWISLGVLIFIMLLFDAGFAIALTYLKPPGMSKAFISKDKFLQLRGIDKPTSRRLHGASVLDTFSIMTEQRNDKGKMVLPFQPLTVAFKNVEYFVNAPQKKIQLLNDITGAFRPGILTALMGVTGAGKTTLLDVLSGRKTGGLVEGDIRIGGYPKVQKTFARVSGYCEQNDIHSPYITVEESLIYSAQLRLAPEIQSVTKMKFVEEVIETIELEDIKDSLVGIPGRSGLSNEQRKRLTIAVELVSNPSVIFMDEPTTGLDARAAAIVMRAVRNVVCTGRTTVCTIHQPSIDVFEAFDELILMKMGGKVIYSGKLGSHSSNLIEYYESVPGLPKIKDNYNPATWMLEVTSQTVEEELNIDFSRVYKESSLYRDTLELVEQLSEPLPGTSELHFATPYPQNNWEQFKACLRKQHLSYWRNPDYNLIRVLFNVGLAMIFGVAFWQKGNNLHNEQDLFSIFGSMYIAVTFLGLSNCSSILPVAITERTVLYREKFARMYSPAAYSLAQLIIEIPYLVLQAILFVAITYPTIGYNWSAYKIFWYFYATLCTFLYYIYMGLMIVSVSSSLQSATISAVASYTILSLFSGFLIPGAEIPKWWIWLYWICPTSWSLNGLLTSQYGDVTKEIQVFGQPKAINSFLEDYYGFSEDRLGLVAAILIAFPVLFASLFVYFTGKLNFQRS